MPSRSLIAGFVVAVVFAGGTAAQQAASEKSAASRPEPPAEPAATQDEQSGETPSASGGAGAKKTSGKKSSSKAGDKGDAAPAPTPQSILPPLPDGDKIHMVSGTVMTGVQVLRGTPQFYEIELVAGEPPIQVPRRQVKSIEYDDIDPVRERLRKQLFPGEQEVTIASGERVTGALRDKLMAPVSAEPVSYKDEDFVEILDKVKAKTGTKLQVDASIEEKPANQRRWSVEVPAGKTLMALLREDLVAAFDYVEVIFESDSIFVMTKEAAKKRSVETPGDAAEAPTESPPATPETKAAPAPGLPVGFPGRAKPPAADKP